MTEYEWGASTAPPPGTPAPSGPPSGPTHPTPTRPGEPAPPKNRLGDYEWGAHKPEEVAGPGRATVTSSPSCPTPPSGMRLDIGRPRDGVTAVAAREAEALRGADAGVRVGRVAVPAASTLPTHRLANERLRGAW